MKGLAAIVEHMTAVAAEVKADNDRADAFTFAPACRELAAHFLPGADAIGIDYLAQALMDCAQEYLAMREKFK